MAPGFCCGAASGIVRRNKRRRRHMTKACNALTITALVLGCALGATSASAEDAKPPQKGVASWYGPGFHGKKTANGERFNTHALTAAHKTLPFDTKVRVTNETTGKSRSEEHTSELQSRRDRVCRLLPEKKTRPRPERQTASPCC